MYPNKNLSSLPIHYFLFLFVSLLGTSVLFAEEASEYPTWDEQIEGELADQQTQDLQDLDLNEEIRSTLRNIYLITHQQTALTQIEDDLLGSDHSKKALNLSRSGFTKNDDPYEAFLELKRQSLQLTGPLSFTFNPVFHNEPYFLKKALIPLYIIRDQDRFLDLTNMGAVVKTIDGLAPVDYLIQQGVLEPKTKSEKNQDLVDRRYLNKIDIALENIFVKSFPPAAAQAVVHLEYDKNRPQGIPQKIKIQGTFFVPDDQNANNYPSALLQVIDFKLSQLARTLKLNHPYEFRGLQCSRLARLASTKDSSKPENTSSLTGVITWQELVFHANQNQQKLFSFLYNDIMVLQNTTKNLVLDLRNYTPLVGHNQDIAKILGLALSKRDFTEMCEMTLSLHTKSLEWVHNEHIHRSRLLAERTLNNQDPARCETLKKEIKHLQAAKQAAQQNQQVYSFPMLVPSPDLNVITPPHYSHPIIVIIDSTTRGYAEVLASMLQAQGATLIGQHSAGEPTIECLEAKITSNSLQGLHVTTFASITCKTSRGAMKPLNYVGLTPDIIVHPGLARRLMPNILIWDALKAIRND